MIANRLTTISNRSLPDSISEGVLYLSEVRMIS